MANYRRFVVMLLFVKTAVVLNYQGGTPLMAHKHLGYFVKFHKKLSAINIGTPFLEIKMYAKPTNSLGITDPNSRNPLNSS